MAHDDNSRNLYAALRAGFPADLDETAIRTCDGPDAPLLYTWGDLERGSAMVANVLASLDLPPASRVAVQVDKSVEAVILYLGVLRAGHVFLPLNTAYQAAEIEYFIGNAEPAVVVCAPANFRWIAQLAFAAGTRNVLTLGDRRDGTLLERAARMPDTHRVVDRGADDLAAILYTSGTTGRSKGAMLTHGNLLSNARTLQQAWGWRTRADGGDCLVHALPIFHVHGLFVALHGALINGSPMLWFHRFEPRAVIASFAHATVFMGVPTLYVRMLAEPSLTPAACANMRLFISGSAPLLPQTFDAWTERTGHVILERYGMSETTMITTNPYRSRDGARRAGTVGHALAQVQVRIQDDSGATLPAGTIGGVQVRGPNVFAGYWRMPEKTAEEFTADGWFRTGDVGQLDDDGRLTLVGRSKDLIITGGYNVYPVEVEELVNAMPGVDESAVIGVPHPDFGEGVVAVVVARTGAPAPDPDALVAALRERIAAFKVPKRIHVVETLPRNAMGKVQKNVLRERFRDDFAA